MTSQLLSVLRDTADFLHRQGVGEGAAAVDEVVRWVEMYGEPEDWAKRAQAAHGRAEKAEAEVARLREALDGLAQAARWLSTEAEYTVRLALQEEFVDALHTAERLLHGVAS